LNEPILPFAAPPETLSLNEHGSSERSFRIVHISDPHLSRQYYREHIKSFKVLLRTVVDEGFDHLVISGDIVSTADPDDYYLAREILGGFGLLDSKRLTIVPGNHDVFGGPHRATDVLSFPQHIRSVDYKRGLALFEEAFAETFEGVQRLSSVQAFPFLKQVGPVNILGLNSIPPWSLRRNILGTNGSLDDAQWEALDRLKQSPDRTRSTVAVIHHHFTDLRDASPTNDLWRRIESRTMRMRKRRKLLRYLTEIGVGLVLHGHIHRNEVYSIGDISFANGAGAVCDDPVKFLKYNRVSVRTQRLSVSIRNLAVPYQAAASSRSFHTFRSVKHVPGLVEA
jgi:3',5'-cyclic-AMP phosphodiesterase